MAAFPQLQIPNPSPESVLKMQTRMECQSILASLVQRMPAVLFASLSTVDGRSFAHADAPSFDADAQRSAAIMSSLLGLIESFARETLDSPALYNSIATGRGSIVIVRVPSKAGKHALCVCTDASTNLAMTIRAALDTAEAIAGRLDADA